VVPIAFGLFIETENELMKLEQAQRSKNVIKALNLNINFF
jgi:hypothetical protein